MWREGEISAEVKVKGEVARERLCVCVEKCYEIR